MKPTPIPDGMGRLYDTAGLIAGFLLGFCAAAVALGIILFTAQAISAR